MIGIPQDESLPHVTAAHFDGGVLAGRALVQCGYTTVGYIGLSDSPASKGRQAGLTAALAEAGQRILPEHIGLGDRAGKLPNFEELGWQTHASLARAQDGAARGADRLGLHRLWCAARLS